METNKWHLLRATDNHLNFSTVDKDQFSPASQLCPTLCNPMDCSMPGFPVYHQLPDLTQTHIHQVSNTIQPSHPLSSPSPTFNLSQPQGLFQWVSSSHQLAKVLKFQLQCQSFEWKFRTDFLYDWLDESFCSPRDSQRSTATTQFSFLYSPTLTSIHENRKNHSFHCCCCC